MRRPAAQDARYVEIVRFEGRDTEKGEVVFIDTDYNPQTVAASPWVCFHAGGKDGIGGFCGKEEYTKRYFARMELKDGKMQMTAVHSFLHAGTADRSMGSDNMRSTDFMFRMAYRGANGAFLPWFSIDAWPTSRCNSPAIARLLKALDGLDAIEDNLSITGFGVTKDVNAAAGRFAVTSEALPSVVSGTASDAIRKVTRPATAE